MEIKTLQRGNEILGSMTDIRSVMSSSKTGANLRVMYGQSEDQEIRLTAESKARLKVFFEEEVAWLQAEFDRL